MSWMTSDENRRKNLAGRPDLPSGPNASGSSAKMPSEMHIAAGPPGTGGMMSRKGVAASVITEINKT